MCHINILSFSACQGTDARKAFADLGRAAAANKLIQRKQGKNKRLAHTDGYEFRLTRMRGSWCLRH